MQQKKIRNKQRKWKQVAQPKDQRDSEENKELDYGPQRSKEQLENSPKKVFFAERKGKPKNEARQNFDFHLVGTDDEGHNYYSRCSLRVHGLGYNEEFDVVKEIKDDEGRIT